MRSPNPLSGRQGDMRRCNVSILVPTLVCIGGCKAEKLYIACTAIAIPGISVSVQDAATGGLIAANATVVARSPNYTDSTTRSPTWFKADSTPISLAYEHAGVYAVTVSKPGYGSWAKPGVTVSADECHVKTVQLAAVLQAVQ